MSPFPQNHLQNMSFFPTVYLFDLTLKSHSVSSFWELGVSFLGNQVLCSTWSHSIDLLPSPLLHSKAFTQRVSPCLEISSPHPLHTPGISYTALSLSWVPFGCPKSPHIFSSLVQLFPTMIKVQTVLVTSVSLLSTSVHNKQWMLDKYLLNECDVYFFSPQIHSLPHSVVAEWGAAVIPSVNPESSRLAFLRLLGASY